MGWLDGQDLNLDDPKTQMLLQIGLGLLGGAPGGRKNVGADIAHAGTQGLLGYSQAKGMQAKLAEEQQQKQLRDMQIQQMQRSMGQQQQIDSLAPRFMSSGQPLTPNDDQGNQMPPASPSMDYKGYANALTGIDPMKGIALQQQIAQMNQKNLQKVGPGESLYDVNAGKSVFSAPDKPHFVDQGDSIQAINPQTGEPIGKPIPKNMSPDARATDTRARERMAYDRSQGGKPHLYDGPTGPVWVTPPGAGLAGQPAPTQSVLGPDGKPIDPKKRDQPLTEAQGTASFYLGMMTDAGKRMDDLKGFDPSIAKNQAALAFARGDFPKLPKAAQNLAAGAPAQKYAQNMYQWTEAMLRATTGATAPEPEVWRIAKTYFVMPGDGKDVIAQKSAARTQMVDYMRIKAGSGAAKVDAAQAARDPAGLKEDDPLGLRK